uniref:Uncharacterized protein TCIL3000_7_3890 n=1 Tax=Trypanosoma congolense (strain IL3000) TaxID=1068625 RepID=G0UQB4_TRYCI|nr:unnamed protein product [Trypanosoma congolense IL3000]
MKIASEADIDRTTQNNKVLSTLLMQLNDLCPGSGTHIMDQSDYDLASHSVTRNLERNERMGSYRAKSCFTIDGDGRVKFSSNGATLERVQVSFKKKPELQRETAPQCVQAEVPLTVFEAIKNGLPKDNKGEPLARELRCAPLSGFTSVIGQCPASHRVRALRREVKSLGEEVERTSILPIRGFIPTSTARFVVHGM